MTLPTRTRVDALGEDVAERHAEGLALPSIAVHGEEAAVHAGGGDTVLTVGTTPITECERRDDEISSPAPTSSTADRPRLPGGRRQ
jgi:hypothetical protein